MRIIRTIGLILFLYLIFFQTSFQDPEHALIKRYRKVNNVMNEYVEKADLLITVQEVRHNRDSTIIDSLLMNELILRRMWQLQSQQLVDMETEMMLLVKELGGDEWPDLQE